MKVRRAIEILQRLPPNYDLKVDWPHPGSPLKGRTINIQLPDTEEQVKIIREAASTGGTDGKDSSV